MSNYYSEYKGSEVDTSIESTQIRWDDLKMPFIGQRLDTSAGRVDYNYADNTVDYAVNATAADIVNFTTQYPHSAIYGTGAFVHPHIHWFQTEDEDPAWRMDWRIINNGEAVGAWNTGEVPLEARKFTYTTGTILQITEFDPIDMSACDTSCAMQFKIYRVGASDSYTDLAAAVEFDLHYQVDSYGSVIEYQKVFGL